MCPEHITITENAIIPLKERVVDRFYDPLTRLLRVLHGLIDADASATERHMLELKPLDPDAVPAALAKAERYRLLNEPSEAESICLDVLAVDAGNQPALRQLLLALTDQFDEAAGAHKAARASCSPA